MRAPTILLAAALLVPAVAGDAGAWPAVPRPTIELAGGTTFADSYAVTDCQTQPTCRKDTTHRLPL